MQSFYETRYRFIVSSGKLIQNESIAIQVSIGMLRALASQISQIISLTFSDVTLSAMLGAKSMLLYLYISRPRRVYLGTSYKSSQAKDKLL